MASNALRSFWTVQEEPKIGNMAEMMNAAI